MASDTSEFKKALKIIVAIQHSNSSKLNLRRDKLEIELRLFILAAERQEAKDNQKGQEVESLKCRLKTLEAELRVECQAKN